MQYIGITCKYDGKGNNRVFVKLCKDFTEAKYYTMSKYNSYLKKNYYVEYKHTITIGEDKMSFRLCDGEFDESYIDFVCKPIENIEDKETI